MHSEKKEGGFKIAKEEIKAIMDHHPHEKPRFEEMKLLIVCEGESEAEQWVSTGDIELDIINAAHIQNYCIQIGVDPPEVINATVNNFETFQSQVIQNVQSS